MMGAPGLVWDACSLLNLVATGCAPDILLVLGCPSYVVKQVREGEVLTLRPLPEEDPQGKLVSVDLLQLFDAGGLQEAELDREEQKLFVGFAAEIDDGEARSLAVAARRGLWLVTDDCPSLRVAREYASPVPTLTTPDWVKYWSEQASADASTLTEAIRRIQVCASYHPRRAHPLKAWWDANAPSMR
jgi:hypothetical protein